MTLSITWVSTQRVIESFLVVRERSFDRRAHRYSIENIVFSVQSSDCWPFLQNKEKTIIELGLFTSVCVSFKKSYYPKVQFYQ